MGTSQKEDTFLTSLCEEMPGAPAPFTLGEPCPEASQSSESTEMRVTLRRRGQRSVLSKCDDGPTDARQPDAPAGEGCLIAWDFPRGKRETQGSEAPRSGEHEKM